MKELVKYETAIGETGAVAAGVIAVEQQNFVLAIKASMPIVKIIEPATKALDSAIDKLKAAIPGQWDDVLLEKVKIEYKEEIAKHLGE